jgi:YHS domain-containing protein
MKASVITTTLALVLGMAGSALAQHGLGKDAGHGKPDHKAPTTKPATRPTTQKIAGKPVNQFCPVMSDEKIDPKLTTVYQGKTIGVCCEDCIAEFHKDPEKYLKAMK